MIDEARFEALRKEMLVLTETVARLATLMEEATMHAHKHLELLARRIEDIETLDRERLLWMERSRQQRSQMQ